MRPIGIRCREAGQREDVSLERDSDRAIRERRMTVRVPAADYSAPLGAPHVVLQGGVQGATSPRGPASQPRAIFRGGAPAQPNSRTPAPGVQPGSLTPCRIRPWGGCTCCAGCADRVALRGPSVLRHGVLPATTEEKRCAGGTTARERGRGHDNSAQGVRGVAGRSRRSPEQASVPTAGNGLCRPRTRTRCRRSRRRTATGV